ncbi:hypothetical protein KFE98_11245 [bacterium SCSIO 12741]|nr:hypothetical protein KFE98_11245 [bacterium SCSIO 12741]
MNLKSPTAKEVTDSSVPHVPEFILSAIYQQLSQVVPTWSELGLMGGISGIGLFLKEYERAFPGQSQNLTQLVKERLIEEVNSIGSLDLSDGLMGVTWALNHLFDPSEKDEDWKDFEREVIELAISNFEQNCQERNTDYLYGAGGDLFFLIESGALDFEEYENRIRATLALLIEQMQGEEGKAYFLSPPKHGVAPLINLGIAHGMPAYVALFSRISSWKNWSEVDHALTGMKGFMQSIARFDQPSCFPYSIEPDNPEKTSYDSRLAWCYGDPGIALQWIRQAELTQDTDTYDWALNIALHASLRRDKQKNGLVDPAFCHGTVGMAHLFQLLAKQTDREEFLEASNHWIQHTVKDIQTGELLQRFTITHNGETMEDYGILTGIAGIGMTLLGQNHSIQVPWDHPFLINY